MAVESTATWQEIVQTRAEAGTMAETTEQRNGKEVRISRSRTEVAIWSTRTRQRLATTLQWGKSIQRKLFTQRRLRQP